MRSLFLWKLAASTRPHSTEFGLIYHPSPKIDQLCNQIQKLSRDAGLARRRVH